MRSRGGGVVQDARRDRGGELEDAAHTAEVGFQGRGGIGKTVLAAALVRDETVRRHFPDGIFWLTVGAGADVVAMQIELLERLGLPSPELRSASEGVRVLRDALADRRCVLVVDDVWSGAAAAAFRAAGPGGRVLYTSRDPALLLSVGATVQRIDALPDEAARRLLRSLTQADELPPEADHILEATGCVALALALVGATIGRGASTWQEVVDELNRGTDTFVDHPYADTFKAMQVATAGLPQGDLRPYQTRRQGRHYSAMGCGPRRAGSRPRGPPGDGLGSGLFAGWKAAGKRGP